MKPVSVLLILTACLAQGQVDRIEGSRIAPHMKFLASDLLEGRQPGTRGGQLTEEYIAAQFAAAGLKPGGDAGTYFQNVPLVSVGVEGTPVFSGGLKWLEEVAGKPYTQEANNRFEGDAVFVGYGIQAPEYNWDSYKGVDVKGKVVVMFTSEPPSQDPAFFKGPALTYYGRWTYKFEEATRRGAAAAFIIHTTPTASYGWQVVRGFGREEPQVKRKPGEHALAFGGWLSSEAAARLFNRPVEELLEQAGRRDFRPIPLGVRMSGSIDLRRRDIVTRNVAGFVPGRDPKLSAEAVFFTAHWDHLGRGTAVEGDDIYNGALDNASGVAALIEMARAWASMEPKPRRSACFVAVTGEEAGLLGATYLAQNPPVPTGRIAANLNFDMLFPYGRGTSLKLLGVERLTFYPLVKNLAERYRFTLDPDPRPEAGSYYRSDHFGFARVGVPALSFDMGDQFAGRPEATRRVKEFLEKRYHQPSDEWQDDFDFAGIEAVARMGFVLGMDLCNQPGLPSWQPGDEFLPAREKSWGK